MVDKPENRIKTMNNAHFFDALFVSLNEGKTVKFRVVGKSMVPFLLEGDIVVVKASTADDVSIGRIVLGRYKGNYILHRVVGTSREGVRLAGDGNLSLVEELDWEDVGAVVIQAFRGNKEIPCDTAWIRAKGMMWYYARPFRALLAKIKKLSK